MDAQAKLVEALDAHMPDWAARFGRHDALADVVAAVGKPHRSVEVAVADLRYHTAARLMEVVRAALAAGIVRLP